MKLQWTPYAWAKLSWMCHRGDTEVGGWGVTAQGQPLMVYDFHLLPQVASKAHFRFTDGALPEYQDWAAEHDLTPAQTERIWCHTHPNIGPQPSGVDKSTFDEDMGSPKPHWSVMFILDRGGTCYAELRFAVGGLEHSLEIPCGIAWDMPFSGADHETWEEEYLRCVQPEPTIWTPTKSLPRAWEKSAAVTPSWWEEEADYTPRGHVGPWDGQYDFALETVGEFTGVSGERISVDTWDQEEFESWWLQNRQGSQGGPAPEVGTQEWEEAIEDYVCAMGRWDMVQALTGDAT